MIKEFAELVKEFRIDSGSTDYTIKAGVYKDDECECFIFEVFDLQSGEVFINSFNSEWCPPDQKEWLAYVVSKGMLDCIRRATFEQKSRTRAAYESFIGTFK